MRFLRTLTLALCTLTFLAVPALAEEPSAPPEAPAALPATAGACPATVSASLDDPIAPACYIEVECSDSSIVNCSGTSTCSTSGSNNHCVTCDGNQTCCPTTATCCSDCQQTLAACEGPCNYKPWLNCDHCYDLYLSCISGCSGGCS